MIANANNANNTTGRGRMPLAGLPLILGAAASLLLSSCAGSLSRKPQIEIFNDMRQQPKYDTQGESAFSGFTDGRADRRPVPGTIARNSPLKLQDPAYYEGQVNGMYVGENPLKITPPNASSWSDALDTYCEPCHGAAGTGKGIVIARVPSWMPSSLVEDRVKGILGWRHFRCHRPGRRSMPAYRYQITEHDRWAVFNTSGPCSAPPAPLSATFPRTCARSCTQESIHGTRHRKAG